MPLEFSESMHIKMDGFVGNREIFGRATDVVDFDHVAPPVLRHFGRSTPTPPAQYLGAVENPITSATTASGSPTRGTAGNDTPGSTGWKMKAVGTDNLVDFVKDFDFE